jgi:Tfp pilus assembly protein PilF
MSSGADDRAGETGNLDEQLILAARLIQQGKLPQAAARYRRILKAHPNSADACAKLAGLYERQGQSGAAIECYRRALALQSDSADCHKGLATLLHRQGKFQEAADSYRNALSIRPDDFEIHYSLGVALHQMGELPLAGRSYARALELNPKCADACTNLGALYLDLGDLTTAAKLQRQALQLNPGISHVHVNLGIILFRQGDCAGAIDSFHRALAIDPKHAVAHCNLGFALELQGNLKGAEECYRRSLACNPESAEPRFYLGAIHLLQGDFAHGWQEYEARWGTREFAPIRRSLPQPLWRGEPLNGARILLHAEQGLGDTIQFVRYATAVAARGGQVILEVQSQLRRLLANSPGVSEVVTRNEALPQFDWHCPLLSLPLAFATGLADIPGATPYLQAEADALRATSGLLEPAGLRVGLAWAGNPKHKRDRQRSIALAQLESLTQVAGTTFYSLQTGAAAQQAREAPAMKLIEIAIPDFADTAALIAGLDLVITVDTAVAHLAGALGKPVWILLHHMPDWRWLLERHDSPWYPTARLFRQVEPGNWQPVIAELRAHLEGFSVFQPGGRMR